MELSSKSIADSENKPSYKSQNESICPDCQDVRLQHPLFGNRDGAGNGELSHFTTSQKCQFCYAISHAFIRSIRGHNKEEEYMFYISREYRGFMMQASFSFEAGFEDSQNTDVSNDRKYLRARFHEQSVGDSSGDCPVSMAFFRIGFQQMSRSLRSSGTNKKYRKPTSLSSKRQIVREAVNWHSVKGWLKTCRESHSDRCQCTTELVPLKRPARVIDVETLCIANTPEREYLTLSYVWGQKSKSNPIQTALKSNIKSLQKPEALSRIGLPNTILDAMYACSQLGHRYLWVDALCIVQDDEEDVKRQIACMSDIYSGAFLTIIAASGEHSNSGLPGVLWGHPRTPQLITKFDGVEMIEILPLLDDVLRNSKWRTRAWTQQEWLLSSRRLYFTDVQVYFECKTGLVNEDPWVLNSHNDLTPRESGSEGRIKFSQIESPNRWIRFRTLLEDYVSRDLSYNDDIFNACTGIYQSVYGSHAKRFIFGHPESNFIEALRWDVFRYDRALRLPEREGFILPSWSWASYDKHMRWLRGNGYTSPSTDEEGPPFCNLVSFKVCLDIDQGYTQVEPSDKEHDQQLPFVTTKCYPEPVSTHRALPGRLLFRTQSTLLELQGDFGYMPKGRNYHRLQVIDEDGVQYAEINVPLQWALSNVERKSYSSKGRQFQFIAISGICLPSHWTISHLDNYVSKKDASVVDEVEKYFEYWKEIEGYGKDRDFEDIFKWHSAAEGKHLHVMLVESHGDACRRIGITSMSLGSWLSTSPKLEDIVLE